LHKPYRKLYVEEYFLFRKFLIKIVFYEKIFRKEILTKKPSNAQKAQKRRAVNARLFYRKTATLVAEVQGILPKKLYRFGVDSNCAAKSQAMRRRHKKGAL